MAKATKKVDIPAAVRPVVAAAAKNLANHLGGAQGPDWGTSFTSLEELTAASCEQLGAQLLHQALQRQADQPLPQRLQVCPACSGPLDERPPNRAASAPRPAPPTGKNPPASAPAAGGFFSPQSKVLGIDLTEHSPAAQRKIVFAGVAASSFANCSQLLDELADLPASTKQVERLTRALGSERVAQRDAAVAAFVALPLVEKFQAPAGVCPPELAVVEVDGGRLQIRERDGKPAARAEAAPSLAEEGFDEEPPAQGFWREDKLGTLLVMRSEISPVDPCPQIPPGFIDVLRIPTLARELGKVAAQQGDATDAADDAPAGQPDGGLRAGEYQPPAVQRRNVVATCRPWRSFAPLVASAAWAAGFQQARRWIVWVWQGEVARVIEQLRQRQAEVGLPVEGAPETSVAAVVARSLVYLSNYQDKMKYPEYRQAGLPLTSSVREVTVKQVNRRVKGTEKFWCGDGAEAIVPLRADYLSDDQPLDDFFEQRQQDASGQRPTAAPPHDYKPCRTPGEGAAQGAK
jgi:hypothetical protein